jgi:hypothetical protein
MYKIISVNGFGMFIPDPGSDFFPSRVPYPNVFITDPGSASKNLSILNHPGSRGQKGTGPGSATFKINVKNRASINAIKFFRFGQ